VEILLLIHNSTNVHSTMSFRPFLKNACRLDHLNCMYAGRSGCIPSWMHTCLLEACLHTSTCIPNCFSAEFMPAYVHSSLLFRWYVKVINFLKPGHKTGERSPFFISYIFIHNTEISSTRNYVKFTPRSLTINKLVCHTHFALPMIQFVNT